MTTTPSTTRALGPDPEVLAEAARRAHEARCRDALASWEVEVPGIYRAATVPSLARPRPPQPPYAEGTVSQLVGWCDEPSPFLVLVGEPGRGKTYAATAVGRRLAGSRAWITRYRFAPRWMVVASAFGSPAEVAYVEALRSRVLILDDVGAARDPGERELERLTTLLVERLNEGSPTIITTNASRDRLAELLGDRVVSRLRGSPVVTLAGPDRRGLAPS